MGFSKLILALGLSAVLSAPLIFAPSMALATSLHRVGQCERTRIKQIMGRISPHPNQMGTGIAYANGILGETYEFVAAIARSRVGDPIKLCLISLPKNCPPGDNRGIFYSARNLRTGAHWTLPNAEHLCGGA